MSGNPNPSPPHRFSSENQPANRGRKKGCVSKSTVQKRVDKTLESMLGTAHENIRKSLRKGDVKTSMWLVDTLRKEGGERLNPGLLDPLVQAVETFEDVERVSQQALMLAIQGDMTFPQLKAVQEALARHSVLKGVVEIGDLRRELRDLQGQEMNTHDLGNGHLPSWGKLKTIDAEPMNKQPAE